MFEIQGYQYKSVLYAKYMNSTNFETELYTNAETETNSCPISQPFDYTYVVDNTISDEHNARRKYFTFNSRDTRTPPRTELDWRRANTILSPERFQ